MSPVRADKAEPAIDAQVFWFKYRKQIMWGLVLAIVLGLVMAGYRLYRDRRETSASTILSAAKTTADYEQIISRYGDTAAAASSYLLLADAQRKERKFAEANATLQNFMERFPQHDLISTARMAIASNLESLGKQDEAFAMYQQIASTNAGSFNAPLALLAQAQILQAKNRMDDARRLCETIITQYRESPYAALEAQRMLRNLKSGAPQTPTAPAPLPTATAAPAATP
jgi:predicted negative regulator of RcsB-dependent stress response